MYFYYTRIHAKISIENMRKKKRLRENFRERNSEKIVQIRNQKRKFRKEKSGREVNLYIHCTHELICKKTVQKWGKM